MKTIQSSLTPLIEGIWDVEGLILILAYDDKCGETQNSKVLHGWCFNLPAIAMRMTSNGNTNRNRDMGSPLHAHWWATQLKIYPLGNSCTSCRRNWLWWWWCKMECSEFHSSSSCKPCICFQIMDANSTYPRQSWSLLTACVSAAVWFWLRSWSTSSPLGPDGVIL